MSAPSSLPMPLPLSVEIANEIVYELPSIAQTDSPGTLSYSDECTAWVKRYLAEKLDARIRPLVDILREVYDLHRNGTDPTLGVVVRLPFRLEAAIDAALKSADGETNA